MFNNEKLKTMPMIFFQELSKIKIIQLSNVVIVIRTIIVNIDYYVS